MLVETVIEDERWEAAGLPVLAETAAAETLGHLGFAAGEFEIALLGCDDARIAELNGGFRGKPAPTNVLSWPEADLSAEEDGGVPGAPDPGALGDIAIAWETCAREAEEGGIALKDHATHLIVHAVLHLLGYDHVREADGDLMEAVEIAILRDLGIENPYS